MVFHNFLPYISQVAVGRLAQWQRLAYAGWHRCSWLNPRRRSGQGLLAILEFIPHLQGAHVWNLGAGVSYSVLDMVKAFEACSGRKVPYRFAPRRPGDIAECWSSPEKVLQQPGWRAERGLGEMMAGAWRWQVNNQNGYSGSD